MALGVFRPGPYNMTYNGQSVGLCVSNSKSLRFRPSVRKIQDTDAYGDCLIDGIYRGMSNVQLLVTFKEWNVAVRQAIWPYGNPTTPVFDGALGRIGQLSSDAAKAIVLTAVSGTPAATNGPSTLTAAKAILSDANDVSILFGPDETDMPVLFDLLLYDSSGTMRFFALT